MKYSFTVLTVKKASSAYLADHQPTLPEAAVAGLSKFPEARADGYS